MRTFTPKPSDITRAWHVIDADGLVLGRVATQVATLLRGKHKPTWAPHVDCGDHVIVVNVSHLDLTPRKVADKRYYRHSGYPGGLTAESLEHLLARESRGAVAMAVREAAQDHFRGVMRQRVRFSARGRPVGRGGSKSGK